VRSRKRNLNLKSVEYATTTHYRINLNLAPKNLNKTKQQRFAFFCLQRAVSSRDYALRATRHRHFLIDKFRFFRATVVLRQTQKRFMISLCCRARFSLPSFFVFVSHVAKPSEQIVD
jgi:hypothetical protein